jgi:hypothetical protein
METLAMDRMRHMNCFLGFGRCRTSYIIPDVIVGSKLEHP